MNQKVKNFLYGILVIPSLYGMYLYFKHNLLTLIILIAFIILFPLIQMLISGKEKKN